MTLRLSLILGNFWLKFRSPDTGIWRFSTRHWEFKAKDGSMKKQKRTDWYRIV